MKEVYCLSFALHRLLFSHFERVLAQIKYPYPIKSDYLNWCLETLNFLSESEHAEEAKHKKTDNPKPPEPATPDYAAGLTPVTQPSKVSMIFLRL